MVGGTDEVLDTDLMRRASGRSCRRAAPRASAGSACWPALAARGRPRPGSRCASRTGRARAANRAATVEALAQIGALDERDLRALAVHHRPVRPGARRRGHRASGAGLRAGADLGAADRRTGDERHATGSRPVPGARRAARRDRATQIKAAHRRAGQAPPPRRPGGDARAVRGRPGGVPPALRPSSRRREWDAAHAPGPMRAGGGPVPRPRAASGRWTREGPEVGTRRRDRRGRSRSCIDAAWGSRTRPTGHAGRAADRCDARR